MNNIDQIIDKYSDYVFSIINNTSTNSLTYQDKEEILSDTFYLFWKNQNKIKTNKKSYLSTIARNLTYQKMRENNIDFELDEERIIQYSNTYDSSYINSILEILSEEEKEIFNMYYVSGYKIREIAKKKNNSNSAIKMRLSRMKKKIRKAIKDERI